MSLTHLVTLSPCSVGGLILDFTVVNYHGIAVFQPVINGECQRRIYANEQSSYEKGRKDDDFYYMI